ncbi:Nucleotidylyl transferase [Tilletiaria anomala UBC 951]|uniref:Nucleotidylyl transferase n=1 Tax=Tilletiaria anomala (strain ATCC 24038 / CBS 436.72 / UBC 951) TaxID=1037660 RepID=A0A066VZ91_TILAU|nr:Nucleotidylyl transferase [Tilletiaria anomala UBC 951]KDN44139.1 Nucleotidylyl transferase [Tilletiaria anomala UBC 951]
MPGPHLPQAIPRMTDSTSGPGGPSSLKFASLSVQSYVLDSPPFTGTAVGGSGNTPGPSGSSEQQPLESPPTGQEKDMPAGENHTTYSSSRTSAEDDGGKTPNHHAARLSEMHPFGQYRQEISAEEGTRSQASSRDQTLPRDQDVPNWNLDSQQRLPPSYPNGLGSPRPAYSMLAEDLDGVEDATSVITDRGVDEEVDGDGTAFVLRRSGSFSVHKVPVQPQSRDQYRFPKHRLPLRMRDESKIPLIIVACGSFSPPTYLHLRIFEMAKDSIVESGKYELLAGYYSPVSDYYKKEGLAKATHRVRMCELAVEKTSTWLMVDAWESLQDEYQRTAVVLDHFHEEVNAGPDGGVKLSDGSHRPVKIMLLAGGDLIQSMGEPGVWAEPDLHHILGNYGCLIVERTGADVWSFLLGHDLLWRYRRNLKIVKQTIYNDISSSKVRLFVRRGLSIKYLLPNSVINYIEEHKLYRLPEEEDLELKETNW